MTSRPDTHRTSTRTGFALLAATRPLGRIALSCGLAGTLGVGMATAAAAGGQPEKAGHASPSGTSAAPRGGDAHRPSAQPATDRPAPQPTAERRASKPAGERPASQPAGERPASKPAGERPAPKSTEDAPTQRAQDPAGNNGTVKVDGTAWDARVDNEPHTSCAFRVTFFGFDEGQTADITVTGVAPTGGGVLLHETAVPTSDDPAGGAAQDFDGATRVYTADDLGLDAVTPHPQQGYHLKVAVDSLEAPGGAKQKVLWLEPCVSEAPVTQPGTQPEPQPEAGEVPSVPGSQPEVPEQPEVPATSPGARPSEVLPAAPVEAAYVETSAPAAELASSVTAVRATQQASALPAELAFTGAGGLGLLALVGAGAAAAGMGLQAARRRAGSQAG
jgi:outer membrane biosynthesis protein TonB